MLNSANGFTGLIDVPADYQAHHLIPQQLSQNSFLKQLGGLVDLNDFATNGIALPRDVATALSGGQTPHLGSHPAYTSFIQNLLDTATSPYDPSVPLTPAESTELAGRVNSIQAYSRMAMSGLLPDSAATPGGRLPLNARDPMIPSNDPADVRAYFQQLQSDLQSKGFTTPESLDRLVDFPRYELLNQANAFDPNLTAAQRGDLARNVDDVRASLDASGRTDLTSGLNDAGRGRYTLSGSTQSSAPASAPAGASPELLQGVESATGRSLATGLTAPESLGTIGSSELAPLNTVAPRDVATLPQIEQPALLPDAAPIIRDNSTIPTIQDNPIVQNDPIVQDNQASVRNTITDMPETRAPGIAEVPETGTVLPETTAPSELPSTSPAAREGAPVADTPRAPVSSELADVPRAPVSEAPAEITGAATGRFTPNFVGVISQSPTASKIFTGAGVLGAAGLAADAGITGYNAYQLYNQGDTLGAGHEVAGFGGRLSGSLTGAYLLGEAGAFGGPWGALGGAIVGGIGGAILGDKGVKTLYDSLTGYQPPTATSSPGWPDQFAAEFDQNNGGAPFSDPMTGFQAESQADYDARRQSYVDSKMADQASQGQQLMDSLRLMPGVDSNALAQNPAVGAPAAASPTPPAVDAQNGLDGANATAPLPAVESVQPAPIDSAPAEMSAPSLTSTEFAPPTLPDQPSGFGATLPSFNLSTTPATEQPLPAAPEPAALPAAIDPAPAEMSAPSLTSAEFAPPTLPDQPSGFTPTMPSFDLNSGFNTGLNSGLDTGIGSFNSGINSGFNSGLNSSFNSGINSSFDSGINSSFDSGINSSFNSGINSSFDSGINSSFDSGLNSSFNSGINSSFDSGSSSSSSLSDFGDSSF
ncbi:MAG: hypothetical protein JWQ17_1122, partial [Tardiphaga sp.]|nr:hypothetical protein [Tardiphaga sp.]